MNRSFLTTLLFSGTILSLVILLDEALTLAIQVVCSMLLITQWLLLYRSTWFMQLIKRVNVVKNLGAVVMIILIAPAGRELGLLNSMVNLLFSGTVLWLFTANYNNTQWAKQVFVGIQFLIAVTFIYQQSLAWTIYLLICVIASLIALYLSQLSQSESFANSHEIQSLPHHFLKMTSVGFITATVLFFLVPALKPFWKLPEQKQTATGLSDTMTPGDIASLASSSKLAFRGQFVEVGDSRQLSFSQHSQRYWRVLTLENFNGKTWSQANVRKQGRTQDRVQRHNQTFQDFPTLDGQRRAQITALPELSRVSIIAEPSQQNWLFAIGTATSDSRNVVMTSDARLLHKEKIVKRTRYEFSVRAIPNRIPLRSEDVALNLRLPEKGFEQTRALANRLWAKAGQIARVGGSNEARVAEYNSLILDYFRDQNFEYTLQPQLLEGEHLDDFLFNTKEGFCSHYASAHAALLRIVGVPARIVTGYHGGEYNAVGDYYNVYDNSAHAWVEFSVDHSGWQRIDPTAVVSPNRIEFGLEQVLSEQSEAGVGPADFVKESPWLNQIRQQLQSLDYYWTVWVLDYDKSKRDNRIRTFFSSPTVWYSVAAALVILILAFAIYYLVKSRQSNRLSTEQQLIFRLYRTVHERSVNGQSFDKNSIDWTRSLKEHQAHLIHQQPDLAPNILQAVAIINSFIFQQNHQLTFKQVLDEIDRVKSSELNDSVL